MPGLSRCAVIVALAGLALGFSFQGLAQDAQAPRLGKYKVIYVRGTAPIYLQNLILESADTYAVFHFPGGALEGRGSYRFDAGSVKWLSGPFQATGYGGTFSVRDGGKVHRLRLGVSAYATNGD